jgi:hypothetical protein
VVWVKIRDEGISLRGESEIESSFRPVLNIRVSHLTFLAAIFADFSGMVLDIPGHC